MHRERLLRVSLELSALLRTGSDGSLSSTAGWASLIASMHHEIQTLVKASNSCSSGSKRKRSNQSTVQEVLASHNLCQSDIRQRKRTRMQNASVQTDVLTTASHQLPMLDEVFTSREAFVRACRNAMDPRADWTIEFSMSIHLLRRSDS